MHRNTSKFSRTRLRMIALIFPDERQQTVPSLKWVKPGSCRKIFGKIWSNGHNRKLVDTKILFDQKSWSFARTLSKHHSHIKIILLLYFHPGDDLIKCCIRGSSLSSALFLMCLNSLKCSLFNGCFYCEPGSRAFNANILTFGVTVHHELSCHQGIIYPVRSNSETWNGVLSSFSSPARIESSLRLRICSARA